jgi:hypothetical protein
MVRSTTTAMTTSKRMKAYKNGILFPYRIFDFALIVLPIREIVKNRPGHSSCIRVPAQFELTLATA